MTLELTALSKAKKPENRGKRGRDLILNEAKRLFWAKGYDRTSIRDISQACGYTQGNIYNYFTSKEQILFEMLLSEMRRLICMIQPIENDESISPFEQLRVFIQKHVEHTLAPAKGQLLHFEMEIRHLSLHHRKKIIELRDAYDRILRKIIRRGVDAGVFVDGNEKIVNYAISSMIVRARIWYSPKGQLSLGELSSAIFELFLNGLRVRKDDC